MRAAGCLNLFIGLVVLPGTAFIARAADARLPVPAAAKLTRANKQIDYLYKTELLDHSDPGRRSLAQDMLKFGVDTTDDSAAQYELLERAAQLGQESGDIKTMMTADQRLSAAFDIDGLGLQSRAIQRATDASTTPEAKAMLAGYGIQLIQQLLEAERYDETAPLCSAVRETADASQNASLKNQAMKWVAFDEQICAEHKRLKPKLAALAASPGDADANHAVGEFYCVYRNDWERALPLLVKGPKTGRDSAWQALAEKELEQSTLVQNEADLAEAWWHFAETRGGPVKSAARNRADYWYRNALAGLSGLSRMAAEKRLAIPVDKPMLTSATALPVDFTNTANAAEGPAILNSLIQDHAALFKGATAVDLLDVYRFKDFKHGHGENKKIAGAYASPASFSHDGGMWLWGIYKKRPPGKYVVAFRIQSLGQADDTEFAFFDLAVDGNTIDQWRPKASELPTNAWINVPVAMNLDSEKKVEIRLWTSSHPIALDKVYVFAVK